MQSTYQFLAELAQSAGLVYFVTMFLGVCAYAMWPRNKARFEEAAAIPLKED
ncbi:MAG TPA: cbb3-type cytochrome c oxidase subunit 3 [Beijerinckiaceae bacterium]|nr:cbb3-type cytochrome c oxidase subunit 3 [Beijerinckiaceae bacterium]